MGVVLDAVLMEGRLDKTALLAMKIAFGGKQTITEEEAQISAASNIGFGEVAWILGQEVAHVFRAEKQHKRCFPHVNSGHASVGSLHFPEEDQWIALKLKGIADNG
jgi:hypothetical protein